MIIKKVSRAYSRSLNTKNYGLPESWIKIESRYEAECESGDDATKVSELLAEQAQTDVLKGINAIIEKIQARQNPPAPTAPVAPAPVAPVGSIPVSPAPVPPQSTPQTNAPRTL